MQKVRRHPRPEGGGSDCLWAPGFRVCFTALAALLFTFPSRYWCAIGRQGVLRLGGWSPRVRAGFHVPRPTRGPKGGSCPYGAVTRSGPPFQPVPVRSPRAAGLVRVRSPLLTESRLMSFPPGTEMFQFPGFAPPAYGFSRRYPLSGVGCPIRRPPDRSPLAAPRGFSQRAASFVASWRQGIHQVPLLPSTPAGGNRARPRRPQGAAGRGAAAPPAGATVPTK